MTIQRKSKRRSHIRIRRYSQNPGSTHAGSATNAAQDAQLRDESIGSKPTESTAGAQWKPRVVSTTPVESAISAATDGQNERDDSEVASPEISDANLVETNDSDGKTQKEIADARSEQPPQPSATEEQTNTIGEPAQDAASGSSRAIEEEKNEDPVAEPTDTKSKSAEASPQDAVDFLMQDFMNSQPPPPPPEEVTWDIQIEPRPLPKGSRIARFATISTLLISIAGIGIFVAYNKLVVPTPVVLGATSGSVEFPEPIHLSNKSHDEHKKQNSNERADTKVPSDTSKAQAQLAKPSTSPQIVPEITSNTSAASSQKPAVDPSSEIATPAQRAPQPEATTGKDSQSDKPPASEPESAEDRSTTAEAIAEGSTQTDIEASYRQAVEKAFKFHKRSQRAKAKKEYQRALDIKPNGAEALGKLAFYSLEESKYAEAIELAERATRVDPNSSEGWIVLGAARQATADQKGAMLAYRKCSESTGQYVKECRRLLR